MTATLEFRACSKSSRGGIRARSPRPPDGPEPRRGRPPHQVSVHTRRHCGTRRLAVTTVDDRPTPICRIEGVPERVFIHRLAYFKSTLDGCDDLRLDCVISLSGTPIESARPTGVPATKVVTHRSSSSGRDARDMIADGQELTS